MYNHFNQLQCVHLGMEGVGQTILTPAAKKQGQHHQQMETIVLQASDRLPSIIQVHRDKLCKILRGKQKSKLHQKRCKRS